MRSMTNLCVRWIFCVGLASSAASAAPELAFKVTSVHFSKEVEQKLASVISPKDVTLEWQKALAANLKTKVVGYDEQVSAEQFGGAILAASATINGVELYRVQSPGRKNSLVRFLVTITATFMDPATGEVFHQSTVEVEDPAGTMDLEKEQKKSLADRYHTLSPAQEEAFASQAYRKLVSSGLQLLAKQVAKEYQPAIEEGKVLGLWKAMDGSTSVAVSLGFAHGLVQGSIVRVFHPEEQEKPVAQAVVVQAEKDRAMCRLLETQFGREVREGLIVRAIGVNKLHRPKEGSLIFQVTGFGGQKLADSEPLFTVDEDVFSMWLTEDLGDGSEFVTLAPLPSISAVQDTLEFGQGVEVAEEDLFGRRRIADVGVKATFVRASILRHVAPKGVALSALQQELDLRLALEFYDVMTGAILFTSETQRVIALEEEQFSRKGEQLNDVAEGEWFRKLARSLIRHAAADAKKRFRSAMVTAKVSSVDGQTLQIAAAPGVSFTPKMLLPLWRPGNPAGSVQESFAQKLGVAIVDSADAKQAKAQFVAAKNVKEKPQKGDEARIRSGAAMESASQLPVVQVETVSVSAELSEQLRVPGESLAELMHGALAALPSVRVVSPAYRAASLAEDAELFRNGDFNLEQADAMQESKLKPVDYFLRGQVESAEIGVSQVKGLQSPVLRVKIRVQLIDANSGNVVYEKAAGAERKPKAGEANLILGGKLVKGMRKEDIPQEFQFACKDLLDKLVAHVVQKGLVATP